MWPALGAEASVSLGRIEILQKTSKRLSFAGSAISAGNHRFQPGGLTHNTRTLMAIVRDHVPALGGMRCGVVESRPSTVSAFESAADLLQPSLQTAIKSCASSAASVISTGSGQPSRALWKGRSLSVNAFRSRLRLDLAQATSSPAATGGRWERPPSERTRGNPLRRLLCRAHIIEHARGEAGRQYRSEN
jgi:hypothetical protein